MAIEHLIHVHSNDLVSGQAKLPLTSDIEYGEIAINYAEGHETIAIKNDNDEIVTLPNNETVTQIVNDRVDESDEIVSLALNNLNTRINTLQSNVSGDVTSLGTRVTTLEGDISDLDGDITGLETDFSNRAKVFYGTCSTDAATTAKVVVCPQVTSANLTVGTVVLVTFEHVNSGDTDSITLNVNNTGAYGIRKIRNTSVGTLTNAGELCQTTYPFVYTVIDNVSYWVIMGVDYNNTYSSMSATEGNTGTSTSARSITAANLKAITLTRLKENQPDWNQSDTTAADYIKNKPDLTTKEDKVGIIAASGTTLSATTGKYYNFSAAVNTLAVTLSHTAESVVQSSIFNFTTGSTPAVTFTTATSGETIRYNDGFQITATTSYEINALWNGSAWVIALIELEPLV